LSVYSRLSHIFSVSPTTVQTLFNAGSVTFPIIAATGQTTTGLFWFTTGLAVTVSGNNIATLGTTLNRVTSLTLTGTTANSTLTLNGGVFSTTPSTAAANGVANGGTSLATVAPLLNTLTISGTAGLAANIVSTASSALTTVTTSSSASVFLAINSTLQTVTSTGTGSVYLTVTAATNKAQTAGSNAVKNAIVWNSATVPSTLVGTGGSWTNFNDFATGPSAGTGTYNIATLQPTGSVFTALNVQGASSITFSGVTPGTPLTIDSVATGSNTYATTGTTGASNSVTVNLGNSSTGVRVAAGQLAATPMGFTSTSREHRTRGGRKSTTILSTTM
jgi:hypothetical protein